MPTAPETAISTYVFQQPAASRPEAKIGPPPPYALAQQHPNYGYDQPGVNGAQNELQMVIM